MQLEVVRKEKGVVESFKLIPLFQLLQNDAKQDWEGVEGSGEGLPPPLILHSQLRYCFWLKLCTFDKNRSLFIVLRLYMNEWDLLLIPPSGLTSYEICIIEK